MITDVSVLNVTVILVTTSVRYMILSGQLMTSQGSQIMENELFNLREELTQARAKLASWEDHWRQAKQVCDAWKHEAEDANNRAALACQERDQMRRDQEQVSIYNKIIHRL